MSTTPAECPRGSGFGTTASPRPGLFGIILTHRRLVSGGAGSLGWHSATSGGHRGLGAPPAAVATNSGTPSKEFCRVIRLVDHPPPPHAQLAAPSGTTALSLRRSNRDSPHRHDRAGRRRRVRERADNRCEYCCTRQDDEPFVAYQIEQIIAIQHGGSDDEDNLALGSSHCNLQRDRTSRASTDRREALSRCSTHAASPGKTTSRSAAS